MPKTTRTFTFVSFPYRISSIEGVRTALASAGFDHGSAGGGTDDFELEGVLKKRELAKLKKAIADAIFEEYSFDESDIEDEDDEDSPES